VSVHPLLDQLKRDADAEVARRLSDARSKAAHHLAGADAELARQFQAATDEHRRVIQLELDHHRDELLRQCRIEELESRRRLVERALQVALTRAVALTGHRAFAPVLQKLVDSAMDFFPPGECVITCHPSLERIVRDAASARDAGKAPVQVDSALGFGFTIESADHRVRVDATLGTLMRLAKADLAIHLVGLHMQGAQTS
jgi:vacuolar-type H+-ATPase subunit E/Vma4